MKRSELEKEAKKRAKKFALMNVFLPAVLGIASVIAQKSELCGIDNPLRTFQCPSESTVAMVIIIGMIINTLFLGLPLAYMSYADTKWGYYGYKIPVGGKMPWVLLVGLWLPIMLGNILPDSIRIWYGVFYFATFYGFFIFELVFYHNLKKKYVADKKRNRTPKMKTLKKVIRNERNEAIRQAQEQKRQAKKKSDKGSYYDDGL